MPRRESFSEYEGSRPASVYSTTFARPHTMSGKRPPMRRTRSDSSLPAHVPRPTNLSFSDTVKKPSRVLPALGNEPRTRRASTSALGNEPRTRRASTSSISGARGSSISRPSSRPSSGSGRRSATPTERSSLYGDESTKRIPRPTSAHGLPRSFVEAKKVLSTTPEVMSRAQEAFKKMVPDAQSQAEQRRKADASFQAWKAKAAEQAKAKRAEETKRKAELKTYYDEKFVTQAAIADEAFEKWLAQKEEEALAKQSNLSEDELQQSLLAPYSVAEVVIALSKIVESDHLFGTLKALFESIGVARGTAGALTEKVVRAVIVEAEIDLEVDSALEAKAAAEARRKELIAKGVAGADKKPKLTEEEKMTIQVGRVILDGVKAQRRVFGQVMSSFRAFFDLSTRNEGVMSKQEFKDVLARLDVTMTTAQLLELFRIIDSDNSGSIEYGELKHFLLKATIAGMDPEQPRKVPHLLIETKEVLNDVSADELDELVVDVFRQAETDRLNKALGQEPGKIGLWQFRRGIRRIEAESLPTSKKKDLQRALEKTFFTLDKENTGFITWATLEFFLRALLLHADRECRRKKSQVHVGWDELSLLRVGKTLVKNIQNRGSLFGKTTVDVDSLFAAMDLDSNGEIDKQELRSSLRRLDCGLTLNQEEAMLRVIDTNGDGVIDISEFRSFMTKVKKNLADEAEAKERMKSGSVALMEDFIKACKWTYSTIEDVCHDLRDTFQVDIIQHASQ